MITRDLRAVLETALSKDRNRRYATAEELAEELRRVRENQPIRARPIGPAARLGKWAARNPVLAGAFAGLLLLVVLLLANKWIVRKTSPESDSGSSDRR